MATEDDKTNTGIAGTALAVGVAAMIAGSAAIVGMARTEIDEWSSTSSAYADLSSIKALNGEQTQQLASAKLPIDKARQVVLSDMKRDAEEASPWTPKGAAPAEASTAASAETAPSTDASATTAATTSSAGEAPRVGAADTTPGGVAPSGVAPSGVAPSGVAPSSTAPSSTAD